MTMNQKRLVALIFLLAVGIWCIYLGFHGWVMNGMLPVQYVGYLLVAFAVLGFFGVNVFYGGPLDRRHGD